MSREYWEVHNFFQVLVHQGPKYSCLRTSTDDKTIKHCKSHPIENLNSICKMMESLKVIAITLKDIWNDF